MNPVFFSSVRMILLECRESLAAATGTPRFPPMAMSRGFGILFHLLEYNQRIKHLSWNLNSLYMSGASQQAYNIEANFHKWPFEIQSIDQERETPIHCFHQLSPCPVCWGIASLRRKICITSYKMPCIVVQSSRDQRITLSEVHNSWCQLIKEINSRFYIIINLVMEWRHSDIAAAMATFLLLTKLIELRPVPH